MKDVSNYTSIEAMLELLGSGDASMLNFNFSLDDYKLVYEQFSTDSRWFSTQTEIVIITIFSFLIVAGLICNGIVFYIILRKGCRQSSRNWYILNMAGSDILTCAVCLPLTVERLLNKNWVLGEVLCKMVTPLQTVYVCLSTFTLVALAGDRYCAIIYNKNQPSFRKCVCVCISVIWLASFALSMPMVVVNCVVPVEGFNGNVAWSPCVEKWESKTLLQLYSVLLLLIQYLSPLLAIATLHLLIVRFLRCRLRACSVDDANIRRKRRRHRRNIFLLSSMAISFGIAWFPLHVINTLAYIDYSIFKGMPFPLMHMACCVLAFSSVCLNPVIYGLLNSNFRRDLLKMCGSSNTTYSGGGRLSAYTDMTRRSSPNVEQMGLITSAHNTELGISNTQLYRVRNAANESCL